VLWKSKMRPKFPKNPPFSPLPLYISSRSRLVSQQTHRVGRQHGAGEARPNARVPNAPGRSSGYLRLVAFFFETPLLCCLVSIQLFVWHGCVVSSLSHCPLDLQLDLLPQKRRSWRATHYNSGKQYTNWQFILRPILRTHLGKAGPSKVHPTQM
jgi:hypothetical protein